MRTKERTFAELVQEVQSGSQQAFSDLMPTLKPIVGVVVQRFWGSGRVGFSRDDFLQEAWMAVYQALDKYDTERYPDLVYSFFRRAIISRLLSLDQPSPMFGMKRRLKRFLRDVLSGRVDWSLTDAAVAESYPGIVSEDVAWARYSYMKRWDVSVVEWLSNSAGSSRSSAGWPPRSIVIESDEDETDERLDALEFLKSFVATLSDFEREVFVFRFMEGRTRVETSIKLVQSVCVLRRVERDILARCASGRAAFEGSVRV